MKILFLCSSLERGKDGVGDYVRQLAGQLAGRGHVVALASTNDAAENLNDPEADEAVSVLRLSAHLPWRERTRRLRSFIENFEPDCLSLQFVPFGFHRKGLPVFLPRRLQDISAGRPWHIMFHELWTGITASSPWQHKVAGFVQRGIAKDLVRRLRPVAVHTSNPLYVELLRRADISADTLPLFGNIERDESEASWMKGVLRELAIKDENRPSWMVAGMFGSCYPDYPLEQQARRMATIAAESGRSLAILGIGGGTGTGDVWERRIRSAVPNVVACHLGRQESPRVSAFLSALDIGMPCTPAEFVGKSGSAAAMVLHGVSLDTSYMVNMPEYRHLRLHEIHPNTLFLGAEKVAEKMEASLGCVPIGANASQRHHNS